MTVVETMIIGYVCILIALLTFLCRLLKCYTLNVDERKWELTMEWYAVEMCRSSVHAASLLGAIQLIGIAAILIFDIGLPKPKKKDN